MARGAGWRALSRCDECVANAGYVLNDEMNRMVRSKSCHLAIIQIVGWLSVRRIRDQRVSLRRIHWEIGA